MPDLVDLKSGGGEDGRDGDRVDALVRGVNR